MAFSDIARAGGAEEELRSGAEQTAAPPRLPLLCGGDEQRLSCRAPTPAARLAAEHALQPDARWRHLAAERRSAQRSMTQTFLGSVIDAMPNTSRAKSEMLTYDDTDFMASDSKTFCFFFFEHGTDKEITNV